MFGNLKYKKMILKKFFLLVSISGFFLLGKLELMFDQYSLEKKHEFRINSINAIDIVDFDTKRKTYLAYEINGKGFVVLLIDENGKNLVKKNLQGQGPGQFSSAMNFLGFTEEGDILVITPNQLIFYDIKLNFKRSEKINLDNSFFTYNLTESPTFFFKDNFKDHLIFSTFPSNTDRFMMAKSLENQHLVEMYDFKLKTTLNFASIKERPIYKHLDVSVIEMYKPIFVQNKKKNLIYITANLDNEITIIDLNSRKTISKIEIKHGDFGSFKKFPISDKSLPSYPPYTLASVNRKIISFEGGLVVLNYVKEISSETFEKNRLGDPMYHHFQDPKYHRLILFDQAKQVSGDIPMPKNGHLMISLPGNRLLFKIVDPDIEEDFLRYAIYEIVEE